MSQAKTLLTAPFLRFLVAVAEAILRFVEDSQAAATPSAPPSNASAPSQEEGPALRVRLARRQEDSTRGQIRAAIKSFGGTEFGANEVKRAVPDVDIAEVRNHLSVLANLKEITRVARGRYVPR